MRARALLALLAAHAAAADLLDDVDGAPPAMVAASAPPDGLDVARCAREQARMYVLDRAAFVGGYQLIEGVTAGPST